MTKKADPSRTSRTAAPAAAPSSPSRGRTEQAIAARKERGEQTRRKLCAATLSILRTEGWAALSTVRIAAEAGIAQSGFYRYFKDLDACVEASLGDLTNGIREDVARRRRAIHARGGQADDYIQHYRENIELARAQGALIELLVKRRFDASAVRKPLVEMVVGWRKDLADDFAGTAAAMGMTTDPEALAIAAELVIGGSLTVNEAIMEGRIRTPAQIEHAARALAAIGEAVFLTIVASTAREATS